MTDYKIAFAIIDNAYVPAATRRFREMCGTAIALGSLAAAQR
jgi:hypothetical protein